MENYLSIGKILNFHGIKGEAKVGYTNLEVIKALKKVFLEKNGECVEFKVSSVRFHKNFAIIKFEDINSINELIEFKGKNIYLKKEAVLKSLDDNEFLINDLIGLNVFDDKDDFVGVVDAIEKTPANDILAIKQEGRKENILVPFVSELVPIVDINAKKIVIKPIEGLL